MSNFNFIGNFLGKSSNPKKDGHDMSNMEGGSMPFGVLAPISYYPVVPNEHYRGSVSGEMQTAPMREDNFASLYSNQKAVFVPLSSIWRNYKNRTSAYKDSTRMDDLFKQLPVRDPVVKLLDILGLVLPGYLMAEYCKAFISLCPDYADYTYRSDTHVFKNSSNIDLSIVFTPFQNSTNLEERYGYCFYRILLRSALTNESYFNDKSIQVFVNSVNGLVSPAGTPIYMDVLRLLDNLGYGNFYPSFQSAASKYCFPLTVANTEHHVYDWLKFFYVPNVGVKIHFTSESYALYREYITQQSVSTIPYNITISLLPFFAYQYYINLCERSNYRSADISLMTYDYVLSTLESGLIPVTTTEVGDSFMFFYNLVFEDHANDFNIFYNILSVNSIEYFRSGLKSWVDDSCTFAHWFIYLFSLSNPLLPSDIYTSMQTSVVEGSVPSTDVSDLTQNLVKAMANTSALYALKQDLLRAGVRRDKQMQAVFGVSGNNVLNERVQILADTSSEVSIVGLLNQAASDVAPLGARASRGNGKFGLRFKLDSEEFGYLFIVQSFTCSVFYENFMIDRIHTLDMGSWFNPKFNHLGLEAVKGNYISLIAQPGASTDSSSNSPQTFVARDDVFGYSARNYELKQRVNKVHGAFTNFALPIKEFAGTRSQLNPLPSLTRGNAPYGGFIPTVIQQQSDYFNNKYDLYYRPDMVNNLFVNMVSGGLYGSYDFDHFRCAYVFNVHKVSPMPKLGLFKLDV